MMDLFLQGLVGLFCLPLTALGLKSMFAPVSMLDDLGIEAPGPVGLNTVRGVVGGLFLGSVALLVAGLALQQTAFFVAVAVVMAVTAIGRVVGVVADGFDKAVVRPIVVEVVIAVVLVAAHLTLWVSP
jgi:hypothetical protein